MEAEEEEGRAQQDAIRAILKTLSAKGRYMDRERFAADLDVAAKRADVKLPTTDQEGHLRCAGRARSQRRKYAATPMGIRSLIASFAIQRIFRSHAAPRCLCRWALARTSPTMSWLKRCVQLLMRTLRRKFCPTCPMPGWITPRPRWATKFRSIGISTSTSRRARWRISRRTLRRLEGEIAGLLKGLV